ncbi:oxidoreductase [Sphingobacterium thalpophilum]|uniref:oxidoreductase n=1 Tax=Sphingobacterium thalpophilum TaxID=259 RepID=UPI0024A60DE4|nr:oxidoreductase [Sphingobacterium thalpophilum]
MWTKENIPDLSGKVAVVTGANSGIGYETAKALYEKGAEVIIAARNLEKANRAMRKIKLESKVEGRLRVCRLDLASLSQISEFSKIFFNEYDHLDILINNAGVMCPPASKTLDGFELQFGVNYLGHYALTGHLLPLLRNSDQSRIVTLSSGAATLVDGIDFGNLRLEKNYDQWREYATSKLANILFTYELDRKLKNTNSSIISIASHPGVTRTDLQRYIPREQLENMLSEFDHVMEPWQGALTTLFAATDKNVKGGQFFGPDGEKEYTGFPTLSMHSSAAMESTYLAEELWGYAEKVTNVKFNF